jgi:7,8-dihydropterin-6-yl-methyl-4-(beta-D-ribofuranosyl)aminobenzene 5'-phosphate synthase
MGVSPLKTFQRKHNDHWYTDSFYDEQSVVISTELGLLIITGCCHAGVINTILTAQLITGIPQIYAIIGGLHLHDWEDSCIEKLAYDLQAFNIQQFWLNHCTGQKAFKILNKEIGKCVEWAGTGKRIELPAVCKNAI